MGTNLAFIKVFLLKEMRQLESLISSAGESPLPGISSAALAKAMQNLGADVNAYGCLDELASALETETSPGDLVLVMGAGDVNQIWGRLQNQTLAAAA